jgi:hypothetical protein
MRVYFLSEITAALKLNGLYTGIIDSFERFVDMDDDSNVLAEIVPDGDLLPINFFINKQFFECPPKFIDVYMIDDDALIFVRHYLSKDNKINVVRQTRFCGNLITLFTQGEPQLSCEGQNTEIYNLPRAFASSTFKEQTINGMPVLIVQGDECISVISESGKLIFMNSAESYFCDDRLNITVNFRTCAQAKGLCAFSYDGECMRLEESRTIESKEVTDDILHFAFFESVLTRGDCAKYLCADLQDKVQELYGFLGNFVDVVTPTQKFCLIHPDLKAAGLVYAKGENLFNVKYFSVETENGKITNICQVE